MQLLSCLFTRFRFVLPGTLLLFSVVLSAQSAFLGINVENDGRDTFYRPFDSPNPKCMLRVTNTSGQISPAGIHVTVSVPQFPSVSHGIALFPNGADLAQIIPGDTTWISCWLRGLWEESGVSIGPTPQPFTLEFKFNQIPQTFYTYNRTIYVAQLPNNTTVPTGALPVAGTVQLPPGVGGNIQIAFGTAYFQAPLANVSPAGSGIYAFVTSLDSDFAKGRTWFLKITGTGIRDTMVHIDPYDAGNLDISVHSQGILPPAPAYQLIVPPVLTGNGFWRGAVSETEKTVALIPGQENWQLDNGCPDPDLLSICKLYKFDYTTGQMLWEHTPGWQTWGGDMSSDGQYIAYMYETGHIGNCYVPGHTLRLLDGATGAVLWEKIGVTDTEGKELKISNNNQYLCIGNQNGRVVACDLLTGNVLWKTPGDADIMNKISFGQIRKLLFSADDQYVYVGSGDNYLRKIRMSDGAVLWRCFVGGWPFVNGLSFGPEEEYIAVGAKSCDVSWVRCADGQRMWTFETGNFEDAVTSPDGHFVATFSGLIFDTGTGLPVAKTDAATSAFSADSKILYKLPAQMRLFTPNGELLDQTNEPGIDIGQIPGSQSQWSYLSSDGRYAIIAGRDMGVNGGTLPGQGVLFYKTNATLTEHLPAEDTYKVYPNPFDSEFELLGSGAATEKLYRLWNLLGQEVARGKFTDSVTVTGSGLSAGVYMLECLEQHKRVAVVKVIKK